MHTWAFCHVRTGVIGDVAYRFSSSYGLMFEVSVHGDQYRTVVNSTCCKAFVTMKLLTRFELKAVCSLCSAVQELQDHRVCTYEDWAPGKPTPAVLAHAVQHYCANPLVASWETGTVQLMLSMLDQTLKAHNSDKLGFFARRRLRTGIEEALALA